MNFEVVDLFIFVMEVIFYDFFIFKICIYLVFVVINYLYVVGLWSDKVYKEVKKYCKFNFVWFGKLEKYMRLLLVLEYKFILGVKYVYICVNEIIQGVEFKDYFKVDGDIVLVVDVLFNFCFKFIDVLKFGVIYGGVQKNIGFVGVVIVIVCKDLFGKVQV